MVSGWVYNDGLMKLFLSLLTLLLLSACGTSDTAVSTEAATSGSAVATAVSTADATEAANADVARSANADVVEVRAVETAANVWTFHVTVAHPDTGWEDYADGWDVVGPDGDVFLTDPEDPFTRLLLHPHENEQPFTRSQAGIEIPPDVTAVTVRAHDLVAGWGGQEVVVDLTAVSGDNFTVERLEEVP